MKNEKCCSVSKGGKHWIGLLVIGLVLAALALYVTFWPLQGYVGLAVVFGWTFIITGLAKIVISISRRKLISGWGWYLTYGILSLILGIYLVANIEVTMLSLPMIFAFWLLIQGSFLVSSAISMKPAKGWGWLLTGGIAAVLAAFLLMFNPLLGFLTIMIWTAVGLYIAAFSYIMMALGVRKITKDMEI